MFQGFTGSEGSGCFLVEKPQVAGIQLTGPCDERSKTTCKERLWGPPGVPRKGPSQVHNWSPDLAKNCRMTELRKILERVWSNPLPVLMGKMRLGVGGEEEC